VEEKVEHPDLSPHSDIVGAVKEIYTTELNYIFDLQLLSELFIQPLCEGRLDRLSIADTDSFDRG
jgi:hypothetical protein